MSLDTVKVNKVSIESNLKQLRQHQIEVQGTLRNKLKARHLDWMVNHLNDEVAKELFQILFQDRNERANINFVQSQDITRQVGEVNKLNKENLKLQQEVNYWKRVADDLNKAFELFQKTAIDTTDALYQQLVYKMGERSEICRGVKKITSFYQEFQP